MTPDPGAWATLKMQPSRPRRQLAGGRHGAPLDGANPYTIHFDKGATPPVNAFWSITLYDSDGFPAANTINHFALSSFMPLEFNADGSLDLFSKTTIPAQTRKPTGCRRQKAPST